MSWIKAVEPSEAKGLLAEIYEEVGKKRGRIANIYKIHSLNPEALRAHLDLYMSLLYRRGGLSRAEREMIGVLVSALNGCHYCEVHHSEALSRYEKDGRVVDAVVSGMPEVAPISEREKAILTYSAKLTTSPGDMVEEDVERLRQVGLDDSEILDVNLIASYFNFVNRVVQGLGVPLEREEERQYRY
jgi:uncharacterized peroxidase-related enzyme